MNQPKVGTLIDEVQYAEGSTVSRIVHERPAGSITRFAVDREQSIKEHTSPYDACV